MSFSRSRFLGLTAAAWALPLAAHARDEFDPATSSARPALRVLLGQGDAQPSSGGTFTFRGRAYRGTFERLSNGDVVNVVDLEQYLYAVVPHEMPSSWPEPALQSQAVCARTYVLQRSDPRRGYDVVPSEADQVYPGLSGETPAGRQAVDATAGQIIKYNNAYAQIAYSSCCGGSHRIVGRGVDRRRGIAVPRRRDVQLLFVVAVLSLANHARLRRRDARVRRPPTNDRRITNGTRLLGRWERPRTSVRCHRRPRHRYDQGRYVSDVARQSRFAQLISHVDTAGGTVVMVRRRRARARRRSVPVGRARLSATRPFDRRHHRVVLSWDRTRRCLTTAVATPIATNCRKN